MPSEGGGIISESGGDYFSELGGEIISESGGGLPRNLHIGGFTNQSTRLGHHTAVPFVFVLDLVQGVRARIFVKPRPRPFGVEAPASGSIVAGPLLQYCFGFEPPTVVRPCRYQRDSPGTPSE